MKYIALLRAVNVAGHNRVRMEALREMFLGLGLEDPRTLLQSGNAVFTAAARRPGHLERRLGEAAKETLGVTTEFFVRTGAEWKEMIRKNPFSTEAKRDPARLIVYCLRDAPDRARIAGLRESITGPETAEVRGRSAYIVYPSGTGRSRLTTGLIEKKLGTIGTGRNWNTVLKLDELARA